MSLESPRKDHATQDFRSHTESVIAELLDSYGLPFIYEKPTAIVDNGLLRIWYPDFTLYHGPIIEYFGIYGNAEYDRRTAHKIRTYERNQFDVIPVYSRDMTRGWESRLLDRIDHSLESRLTRYRSAITHGRNRPFRYACPFSPYRF